MEKKTKRIATESFIYSTMQNDTSLFLTAQQSPLRTMVTDP